MSNVTQLSKLVVAAADVGVVLEKFIVTPGPVLSKVGALLPLVADVELLAGVDYKEVKAEALALDTAGELVLVGDLAGKLTGVPVAADVVEGIDLLWQLEQLTVKFIAFGKKLKG